MITEAEFTRFQREWYDRHEATLHRPTEPLHFQQLLSQIGRKLPRFTTPHVAFDGKTWTLAHALARGKFGVAVLLEQHSSNRRRGQPPRMVMKVDRDHFSVHWEATVHSLVRCSSTDKALLVVDNLPCFLLYVDGAANAHPERCRAAQ
jgi:hypothetical protein